MGINLFVTNLEQKPTRIRLNSDNLSINYVRSWLQRTDNFISLTPEKQKITLGKVINERFAMFVYLGGERWDLIYSETPRPVTLYNKDYVRAKIPGDGWCSMHVVDKLLQVYLGDRNEPKLNVVPKTLDDLIAVDTTSISSAKLNKWLIELRDNPKVWFNSKLAYASPDIAATYIQTITNNMFELGRNLFITSVKSLPEYQKIDDTLSISDAVLLLKESDDYNTLSQEQKFSAIRSVSFENFAMFVHVPGKRNANHWELVYSRKGVR